MHLRTPLPDELAYGFLADICRDNVMSSTAMLATALGVPETARGRDSTELPAALLSRLGICAKALVCQHSLVPVTRSVRTFDPETRELPHFGEARYLRIAFWPGQAPRLCRDCVSEDLSFWGLSYYRRSHQLHGITWCAKHRRPLSVAQEQHGLWLRPHHAQKSAQDLSTADVEIALRSAAVGRFSAVLESLLDNTEGPIHSTRAAHVIRARAEEKGLRFVREAKWKVRHLSDVAKKCFPERWLTEFFPASQQKRSMEFSRWIDMTGLGGSPVSSYAFAAALALLWDDPDVAVRTFLDANRSVAIAKRAPRSCKPRQPRRPTDHRSISYGN